MKLVHLKHVTAVAEHGSLRSAGRHLGIPQPAISRSIREIENELGVALFIRHSRGVEITDMGKAFVARAESIQFEIIRATEEIEQLKGETTGHVAVALSSATSIALMPRTLTLFRKRYPKAFISVSESLFDGVETNIIRGKVDLYVGPIPENTVTKLKVEKLFDNKRVIISRKDHPLQKADSFDQLKDALWIETQLSRNNNQMIHSNFGASMGFPDECLPDPEIIMYAHSALITLLAVASSDMLAILPRQWLENPATSNQVLPLKHLPTLTSPPVCIARRSDTPLTPMAEYFYDQIHKVGKNYARTMGAS